MIKLWLKYSMILFDILNGINNISNKIIYKKIVIKLKSIIDFIKKFPINLL